MMSKKLRRNFELLNDDEFKVIKEVCRQSERWASSNKTKLTIKIIDLNGTFNNGGIYVAHDMFDEVMVEYSSDFIKSLMQVLDEYCDTNYYNQTVEEFWLPVLEAINL